jgi:hypothetical protein
MTKKNQSVSKNEPIDGHVRTSDKQVRGEKFGFFVAVVVSIQVQDQVEEK